MEPRPTPRLCKAKMKLIYTTLLASLSLYTTASAGIQPFVRYTPTPTPNAATGPKAAKIQPVKSGYQFFPALGNSVKKLGHEIGGFLFCYVQDFKIFTLALPGPVPVSLTLLEIDNRPLNQTLSKK